MQHQSLTEIADQFGLVIESENGRAENERSFRVYKGANQVFTGTEEAIRTFFRRYERDRPGLFVESMYGYKE